MSTGTLNEGEKEIIPTPTNTKDAKDIGVKQEKNKEDKNE